MHFGKWDDAVHDMPNQILKRGRLKDVELKDIDSSTFTAHAIGSEGDIYSVSLDSCTCTNFIKEHKPCKHIYRLAKEFGYSEDFPELDVKANREYRKTVNKRIEECKLLFLKGAISFDIFKKIVNDLNASAKPPKKK